MEFKELNFKLQEGNTYIIKDDEYHNEKIILKSSGTPENPIVISTENAILSQKTQLTIKGSNIIIEGFTIRNCMINKMINIEGNNIIFRNNVIEGLKKDIKSLIKVVGQNVRITKNKFVYFDKEGCLIFVQHKKDKPSYCLIDNNTFGNRKKGERNELIRLGNSESSLWDGCNILYNNTFSMCYGDNDVVSVECCKNIIYNNKFTNCEGGLSLRYGKNNFVLYNYFDGSYTPNSSGIKICDTGHKIYYNTLMYFDTNDNPSRSPLTVMCGQLNNKLYGYAPVENVDIKQNDFISCNGVLSLGVKNKSTSNIKPKQLKITENRFIKCVDLYYLDEKKILGYEDCIITNNHILKYDQKLLIKKPENIDKMKINELYEKLLNLDFNNDVITKTDEIIEKEQEKNKIIRKEPKTDVKFSRDIVIKDNDEEKKYNPPPTHKNDNNDDMIETLKELQVEYQSELIKLKRRVSNLDKIIKLLN